jgi:ligand-binding sensor domain-containing protein
MAEVQVLYIATANGIVQLANPGTSHRWRPVGEALAGQDVLAVQASSVGPLVAYAGTPSGLYATHDGGATWELQREGAVTALAAAEDGTIYVGTDSGKILRGVDGDWRESHAGDSALIHLSVLPNRRIAAIFKSGEVDLLDGDMWERANFVVPCATEVVGSAVDPDELFFGSEKSLVTRFGAHAIPGAPIHALCLLRGKPEVLLVGTIDSVQRSEDGGDTFTPVEGPTNVRVIVSPPRYEDYAYAGTDGGQLWLTTDRGRSWRTLHDGMAAVRDLSFSRVR